MRYSETGIGRAAGITCLPFVLLSELRRFDMLIDLASCLGDALDCVLGGLWGSGGTGRLFGPAVNGA